MTWSLLLSYSSLGDTKDCVTGSGMYSHRIAELRGDSDLRAQLPLYVACPGTTLPMLRFVASVCLHPFLPAA